MSTKNTSGKSRQKRLIRIQYHRSPKDGLWYWRIKSGREVICHSEGITRRAKVLATIKSMIAAIDESRFRIEETTD